MSLSKGTCTSFINSSDKKWGALPPQILYFLGPAGGLFPLPPPEGFPVVLGAFTGVVLFGMVLSDYWLRLLYLSFGFRILVLWTLEWTRKDLEFSSNPIFLS